MPVFTKDDRSVLFIHIPKTGGSTLERHFRNAGWRERYRETRKTSPDSFHLLRCSPQHHHGALLTEMFDLPRFDCIFLIARDPLARFRSEFLMRNTGDPRVDARSVASWHARHFAKLAKNPYHLDNHLRPQHEFLVPGAQVFRLEDGLDSAVATLNRDHGFDLPTDLPHALDSKKRAGVPSSAVELSPEVEEALRATYARDFDVFGYR